MGLQPICIDTDLKTNFLSESLRFFKRKVEKLVAPWLSLIPPVFILRFLGCLPYENQSIKDFASVVAQKVGSTSKLSMKGLPSC